MARALCSRWTIAVLLPFGLLLAAAGPAQAQTVEVDVSIDSSSESTRLILTHSRPVVYAVESSRGRIRVLYADPVEMRPPTGKLDDPILKRYRMRDERTLILETGSEYGRYETFELRNPFRLILDLKKIQPSQRRSRRDRKRTTTPPTIIVIDPGHGGVEHGAVGQSGLREKDMTLALARRLKRELQERDPSISVVLTRDEDRLVGLDERTAVANHNRADLFLSIHLNSSPRPQATGAETYYLSTDATDDEARILAALENSSSGETENAPSRPSDSLDLVLWELAQNQYLAESSALAESIQAHLNALTGTRDRGVRQAPFRVLMGATMPAVLMEVGFISNPAEEAKLRTGEYRGQIVDAVAAAVQQFLRNLERLSAPDATQGRSR